MSRAIEIFRELSRDGTHDEVEHLRAAVRAHLEALTAAQRKSELLALDLAEALASRLDGLLAGSRALSVEHRAAVLGAARYFVSADDAVPDAQSCTGLDDDVLVFNHVVVMIGRDDLRIDE
jgi:uncharacterized membrane protein YkvA (DUF1232 family)